MLLTAGTAAARRGNNSRCRITDLHQQSGMLMFLVSSESDRYGSIIQSGIVTASTIRLGIPAASTYAQFPWMKQKEKRRKKRKTKI